MDRLKGSRSSWLTTALAALLVATILVGFGVAAEPMRLVMAGSSSGGTAHLYFAALSPLLNKYIPGMEASARSGGTTENVPFLERGEAKIAAVNTGAVLKLYGKEGLAKTRIRTVFAMFHAPYHILVPRDSPVKQLADLKGKRVSVGIKGGGEAYLFQRLVDAVGMKESDFRAEYLGKGEAVNAYKDGTLDGMLFLCPLPCPVITELATHPRGARLVPLSTEEVQKLIAKYPDYTDYTIEKRWYTNALKEAATDVHSFTEWYYVAARDDFPEETAYQITKVIAEHHDELVASFKAANSSTAENTAKYPGFALHPGTARYLREKGLLK